ncbi:MAG: phosphoribosyl-AMP cyclohydrolase [Balneolaceae bacterium]|nr:MAG: phosphoribosyl-AMP cyclohydrolase [Balneolaceae bacterium]
MLFALRQLEETEKISPQFEKRGGLLPVAVQEISTGQILMLAYINEEAFSYTLENRVAAFFSTSRNKMWVKGETSGNYLTVDQIFIDCDQDAVVYKVTLTKGGACHTLNKQGENRKACFYRKININQKTFDFLEK